MKKLVQTRSLNAKDMQEAARKAAYYDIKKDTQPISFKTEYALRDLIELEEVYELSVC